MPADIRNKLLRQREHKYYHRVDEGYFPRRIPFIGAQGSRPGKVGSHGSRANNTAPIPGGLPPANRNTRRSVLVLEEDHAHQHKEEEDAEQET